MYGLLSGLREYFTRIMKWRSRGEILVNNYLQYFFSWNEFAKIFKFASSVCPAKSEKIRFNICHV